MRKIAYRIAITVSLLLLACQALLAQPNGKDGKGFITLWNTDNPASEVCDASGNPLPKSDDHSIYFPGIGTDYALWYCGLGETTWHPVNGGKATSSVGTPVKIDFGTPGIYYVMAGPTNFYGFLMFGLQQQKALGDAERLTQVISWGEQTWGKDGLALAFYGCKKLAVLPHSNPDFPEAVLNPKGLAGALTYMFYGCENLRSDIENYTWSIRNWDLSQVTMTFGMFYGCKKFNADLSSWNMGRVTNTAWMFRGCENFNQDLSRWNVELVTNMQEMFSGCKAFTSDLSRWEVGRVTDMSSMFNHCENFNSDLSRWDVSQCTNMGFMFNYCSKFQSDLSLWDVRNVEYFDAMFQFCSAFNCPLGNWQMLSMKPNSPTAMLNYSGLSPQNYDHTLLGWGAIADQLPANITLGALDVHRTYRSATGKAQLEGHGWTINDGKEVGPYQYRPVTNLTTTTATLTMKLGDKGDLNTLVPLVLEPANATYTTIHWTIDNKGIAAVMPTGRVESLTLGETTLHATTLDGHKQVNVKLVVTEDHVVTFDPNDGLTPTFTQTIADGQAATRPTDTYAHDGKMLIDWCTDQYGNHPYDFSTPVPSSFTLYGKWDVQSHTVTFDPQSGSSVPTQTVPHLQHAVEPKSPTRPGKIFSGWFKAPNEANPYDFATPVTTDITLTAKWENETPQPLSHTVTFDTQGGSPVPTQTVPHLQHAVEPKSPSRPGKIFTGWYNAPNEPNPYDFATPITADITLTARWDEPAPQSQSHTVTFDPQGGSPVPSQAVPHSQHAVEPKSPTRPGKIFSGWYKAPNEPNPYDFATPVTADITLTARWDEPTPVENILTEVTVAPNPIENRLHIMNTERVASYTILTATGIPVAQGQNNGANTIEIAVDSWAAGLYIVRLESSQGTRMLRAIKR